MKFDRPCIKYVQKTLMHSMGFCWIKPALSLSNTRINFYKRSQSWLLWGEEFRLLYYNYLIFMLQSCDSLGSGHCLTTLPSVAVSHCCTGILIVSPGTWKDDEDRNLHPSNTFFPTKLRYGMCFAFYIKSMTIMATETLTSAPNYLWL